MIMAICIALSAVLVSCDDTEIVTELAAFNEIVESNVATNGYTLNSVSVDTETGVENGYLMKTVIVEGSKATETVREKRLKVLDIDDDELSKYEVIEHAPVVTNDYAGEKITNNIKYDNVQTEGSLFTVKGTEMTLSGTVTGIESMLNIDETGITNCTIEAKLNLELKKVISFVIVYENGSTTTTLTYNQVA